MSFPSRGMTHHTSQTSVVIGLKDRMYSQSALSGVHRITGNIQMGIEFFVDFEIECMTEEQAKNELIVKQKELVEMQKALDDSVWCARVIRDDMKIRTELWRNIVANIRENVGRNGQISQADIEFIIAHG